MPYSQPPRPARSTIEGRYCRLEPLAQHHAADLFAAQAEDVGGAMWAYMPNGPFADLAAYEAWLASAIAEDDPLQFAVVVAGRAVGTMSLMRIDPGAGTIEIGYVAFPPVLQRTIAATEAFYLLIKWSFEAGYRRLEWKCNALNVPSRVAALRLGLSYEGVFRQATVVKGRNRDTAWFAVIDVEWPQLYAAFEHWLDAANFDAVGQQRVSLSSLTAEIVAHSVAAEALTRPAPGQVGALV